MTATNPDDELPANLPDGLELGPIEDPPDSVQFLERAHKGDQAARNALVVRYEARVRRVVSACMGADIAKHVEVEDVVQHTLAVALERVAEFDYRGEGSILKWLTTIAIHHINDERKRLNVRKGTKSLDDGGAPGDATGVGLDPQARSRGPATNAELRDDVAKFDECVRRLPDEWREIVVRRYYGEFSFDEIARAIGNDNERAVWQRFNRAYARVLSCWKRPRSSAEVT